MSPRRPSRNVRPHLFCCCFVLLAACTSTKAQSQLYKQDHIDLGIPPSDTVAFFSSQLQTHPSPIDDERARVWDNFFLSFAADVTGLQWSGAFDGRFNRNETFRGEIDFLVQVFGHDGGLNSPDLSNLLQAWTLDGGSAGRNDGTHVRTEQRPNEVSSGGGLVYDYLADLPSPLALGSGAHWLSITAIQTFPSPDPRFEPLNNDAFFDPIWGWHVGDGPDGRAFQFDAIRDTVEPGTAIGRDFSFTIIGNPHLLGDFDNNGALEDVDIDLLSLAVNNGSEEPLFDVNGDGLVNELDRQVWIFDVFGTFPGDVDLNKEVKFNDFLILADAFAETGGWGRGDFTGDGFILFADFLLLAGNFGKEANAILAVPEPTSSLLLIACTCLLGLLYRRRRT